MDGNKYEGQFEKTEMCGLGTLTLVNGGKYSGQFKDNEACGQGTLIYVNGEKEEGQFKGGELHGYGTRTFTDGDKWMGQFENGVFLEDEDSQVREEGLKEKHELVIIIVSGCFIVWLILSDLAFWAKVKIYLWLLFGVAVLGLCVSITRAIFDRDN